MKVQKIQKMMRKDVSGGQRSKFKKSKKMMIKDFQEVDLKNSEKMIRKDVSKGRGVQDQEIRKND